MRHTLWKVRRIVACLCLPVALALRFSLIVLIAVTRPRLIDGPRFLCNSAYLGDVADTFWSVDIKCCFHQKKTKSKRPTTNIKSAERQRKGRDQSSTKNVTSKTLRLHKVAKQHKASDRSVGNPKTSCIQTKSNKI